MHYNKRQPIQQKERLVNPYNIMECFFFYVGTCTVERIIYSLADCVTQRFKEDSVAYVKV